jgi:hypothetical protein
VPQFVPTPPIYNAALSDRIGVTVARRVRGLIWSHHIRSSYFSNSDLAHWTLENPYLNPFRQITFSLPESEDDAGREVRPWFEGGVFLQDLPWVNLETSLQWGAFRRLVEGLESRGNRVFVLVGPLNEHMLEPGSRGRYRGLLTEVESWLEERGLPYHLPAVLPSELYADLSHPLAEGYAHLARDLQRALLGAF